MKKEQPLKGEPRQAGNRPFGNLRAPTGSKVPSSGITQPHNAKKEALGPNTNR
ncbi:hypothetical protein SDC9_186449 [bioreactor metagenome]|uniref:Uncharacterized protein n=1 Tax=bioreactor metagenome TaxID=1076179 RepID=A0A645HS09_9ZZZZ